MSISLYEAFVPTVLQVLGAGQRLLVKAETHCVATGMVPADLLGMQLAPDMLPLTFLVFSMMRHSSAALDGVRAGTFSPARPEAGLDFAALKAMLEGSVAALEGVSAEELAELAEKPVLFTAGERSMPFVAKDFLLSFSQPNFFFHASMLYAILRNAGLPLSKMDFIGRPRFSA